MDRPLSDFFGFARISQIDPGTGDKSNEPLVVFRTPKCLEFAVTGKELVDTYKQVTQMDPFAKPKSIGLVLENALMGLHRDVNGQEGDWHETIQKIAETGFQRPAAKPGQRPA